MTTASLAHPIRYVALGDSFTEGVGDEHPDGSVRGWADLVAQGIADASGHPVHYANLAIRGRLLDPIIDEQLEAALALSPTLVSFNGGGNDMLRPRTDLTHILERTEYVLTRIAESGATPLLIAGANPTAGLPGGASVSKKGDRLTAAVTILAQQHHALFCNNWSDPELTTRGYWSPDRLHLATVGHYRVATNVLRTLGYTPPANWNIDAEPKPEPTLTDQLAYFRQHIAPWVKRRITGASSGDGRSAKFAHWTPLLPRENSARK